MAPADDNTVSTEFLQSLPLFGGLEDEAVALIRKFLQFETFEEESDIIAEGATGNRLYILLTGSAEVTKLLPNPTGGPRRRITLARLKEGDTFGEMELIDTMARSATVRATEASTALSLTNMDLYRIFLEDPDPYRIIITNIARDLSRRLSANDERLLVYEATLDRDLS